MPFFDSLPAEPCGRLRLHYYPDLTPTDFLAGSCCQMQEDGFFSSPSPLPVPSSLFFMAANHAILYIKLLKQFRGLFIDISE